MLQFQKTKRMIVFNSDSSRQLQSAGGYHFKKIAEVFGQVMRIGLPLSLFLSSSADHSYNAALPIYGLPAIFQMT